MLDNDKRDYNIFQKNLNQVAKDVVMLTDYAFCIAVKEMEAWLLGDEDAIYSAYPEAKKKFLKNYKQDEIVDTWEVLANMVYPGGLAKCEWADKIGQKLVLEKNVSPSFQKFLFELCSRIEAA